MRRTTKIVNLATALGALVSPGLAPESANAARLDEGHPAGASDAKERISRPRGEDLMTFTVHTNSDGTAATQASHESHASHASHASHVSGDYDS
jgi:hypothetical protein